MGKQQTSKSRVLLGFASFFERALDAIKPPYMKFFVVLVVAMLLYLLLRSESISQNLGLVSLVVVVLTTAFLVTALQYTDMRFRYSKRMEEQLKKALRDTVLELQEERIEQISLRDIQITYVEYDPPGNDVQGEFVRIENPGRTVVDMTGWTLRDEIGHLFTFPTFTLRPGKYVRVWTKARTNTATDLYWGRGQAVWNNTGDCAYLQDSTGRAIDTCRFG